MDKDTKEYIDRHFDRLYKKLSALVTQETEKAKWIGATVVTRLTGWNSNKMRTARNNGVIKFRRKPNGRLEYLEESVMNIPAVLKQNQ